MAARNPLGPLLGDPFYTSTQIAIGCWLIVASRLQTGSPPALSGAMDDLALVFFFTAWQHSRGSLPSGQSHVLAQILGV